MKLLSIFILTLLFSNIAKSQIEKQFKNKLWDEYKNKKLDTDKFKLEHKAGKNLQFVPEVSRQQEPEPDEAVVKLPLKGEYLGSNGTGDEIYAMEPDNMPCLVPGKTYKSNMPVVGSKVFQTPLNSPPGVSQEKVEKLKQEIKKRREEN